MLITMFLIMTIISFNFNPFSVEGGSETVEVQWWWKVDVEEQVRAGQGEWEKRRDGSVRNSRGYIFRKRKQFPMECDSGLVADSYTVALLSLSLSLCVLTWRSHVTSSQSQTEALFLPSCLKFMYWQRDTLAFCFCITCSWGTAF